MSEPQSPSPAIHAEGRSASPHPGPARRTAPDQPRWLVRPEILQHLSFSSMFGDARPVELEIGAGDGSFILQYASQNPDRNFFAVERLYGRLRKIDRKARLAGITNLRGMRIEAGYLMERMIAPESLAAIHVYFPDPWPKRRHWKHRLIQDSFAPLVHRALIPGGILYLRTDHTDYFDQMKRVMSRATGFEPFGAPESLLAIRTDFERDFNAKGIPSQVASYRKVQSSAPCTNPA